MEGQYQFHESFHKREDIESPIVPKDDKQYLLHSLADRKRSANRLHQMLFCRGPATKELITVTEQKTLQDERKKYLQFLKKNQSDNIPDIFRSWNKFKEAAKNHQQLKQQQASLQPIAKRKRQTDKDKKVTKVATSGQNKKVKAEGKKEKKGDKANGEDMDRDRDRDNEEDNGDGKMDEQDVDDLESDDLDLVNDDLEALEEDDEDQ